MHASHSFLSPDDDDKYSAFQQRTSPINISEKAQKILEVLSLGVGMRRIKWHFNFLFAQKPLQKCLAGFGGSTRLIDFPRQP